MAEKQLSPIAIKEGVTVSTGARLHFGPLSYLPQYGRHFGGVGVMIDSPGVTVHCTSRSADHIVAPPDTAVRVRRIIDRWRGRTTAGSPPACIEVVQTIPPHVGLGSGTQLALAVAKSLAVLAGDLNADAVALAERVGRGLRSAVGIHGFHSGGLIVDAGQSQPSQGVGALAARTPFPADWRFVLVTPRSVDAISGDIEHAAFARLPSMPQALTDRLCRIALVHLLPSVVRADFSDFAESLYEYGSAVGSCFSVIQGGVYSDIRMSHLAHQLRKDGVTGVVQSSWGPTLAIVMPNDNAARSLRDDLESDSGEGACTVRIAAPRNRGAESRRFQLAGEERPQPDSADDTG